MSNFQPNPTVAAKDLMRSGNPESLSLEELQELKSKCELVLGELWKLAGKRGFSSSPERSNIMMRRFEMEMFLARIVYLINAHLVSIGFFTSSPPTESPHFNFSTK